MANADSKKILCGLMAIFLGNLGIHKFILGYTGAGVITLVLNFTCIGIPVMRVITIIEGIIYLMKTDEEFHRTYIAGQRQWFQGGWHGGPIIVIFFFVDNYLTPINSNGLRFLLGTSLFLMCFKCGERYILWTKARWIFGQIQ